ncbi:MAG: hypothetical protein R6V20_09445 [Desulfobia sp.]
MKKNEIISTEKLLNLIRGQEQQNSTSPADRGSRPSDRPPLKKKTFLSRISPLGEEITVGVDIGPADIKLVKIAHYSQHNQQLLDIRSIPLDTAFSRNTPDFVKQLRKILDNFCGPAKKIKIWSTTSSFNVEVRLLSLPVVPKHMLPRAARLSFQKETPFNDKEMVFDYDYQGEITESGIKKMSVLAFIAPRKEINAVRDLFSKCGYPLAGVTVIPFALQNLHRAGKMSAQQEPECHLFVGSDWSRIDLYDRGALIMIREVKTGRKSLIQDIMEGVNRKRLYKKSNVKDKKRLHPGPAAEKDYKQESGSLEMESGIPGEQDYPENRENLFVLNMERSEEEPGQKMPGAGEKETGSGEEISPKEAERILESQFEGSVPLTEDEADPGLSSREIFDFIQPSIDRLIRQIDRTISHYTSNFQGIGPTRLFFTGSLGTYKKLVEYTGEQLGITSSGLDPFEYITPGRVEIPPSFADRLAYAPAVGLALSRNSRTPNFLFTQEDKEHLARLARKDRIIFGVFLGVIVFCLGGYIWQNGVINNKKEELASLKQNLERYQPETDKAFLRKVALRIKQKQKTWQVYQEKYYGLAIIGELVSLTPPDMTYQSCNIILNKPGRKKEAEKQMMLSGRMQGKIEMLEPSLANYLVKVGSSPLFDRPRIDKSTVMADKKNRSGDKGKQGTLHFLIRMDLM